MKWKIAAILFVKLTVSFEVISCELTDEYKKARSYVVKEAKYAYKDCLDSVSKAKYWFMYVQCIKAGDKEKVGGGCAHIVGHTVERYERLDIDDSFCSTLKPSTDDLKKFFAQYVKEKNIRKCK